MNRKHFRNVGAWVGLLLLSACTFDSSSDKPNLIPASDEIACERHPNPIIVDEKISTSDQPCFAWAKIQVIAYECGESSNTDAFVQNAFNVEVEKAREKCDQFCKNQSSSCEGVFTSPGDCGLKSPANMALEFGKKEMHCPKTCKGQAFNYCSIYHAAFFATEDRSLFKDLKENCECRKK